MNANDRINGLKKTYSDAISKAADGPIFTNADPRLGYQQYNLDQVVVHYYDTYVPLLALLPREGGQNGVGANWKLVRRLKNVRDVSGAPEGARGQIVQRDVVDRFEPFATLQKDQRVSAQSILASQGLDPDSLASATESLLEIFLQHEHKNILNGLRSEAIPRPAIVAASATATGGALATGNHRVGCVALSYEAYENFLATGLLPKTTTVTLADGTTQVYNGGVTQVSLLSTVNVAGNAVTAVVSNPSLKAAAWAWFIEAGTSNAPRLDAVTTVAEHTFLAVPASAIVTTTFDADASTNELTFNGILAQIDKADSGATIVDAGAQELTATTSGSIREFDDVFKAAWAADRIVFDHIFASADMCDEINQKMLSAGATGAARLQVIRNADGSIEGGNVVSQYRSPINAGAGGAVAKIVTLADLAPGTVLFYCSKVRGATPDVRSPTAMLMAQDYKQEVYAKVRNTVELGIYTVGTVAVRYGAAWGALFNVKRG